MTFQRTGSRTGAALTLAAALSMTAAAAVPDIPLPTGRLLGPAPGAPQALDGFPGAMAVAPGGRFAVALVGGFGTPGTGLRQSLAVLDLASDRLEAFPVEGTALHGRQTLFSGLAFSADGTRVYAAMASGSDARAKDGSDGNGVLVYGFKDGRLALERFLPVPPAALAPGRVAASGGNLDRKDRLPPFCAGLAAAATPAGERLLVAGNLGDCADWIDAATGRVLAHFDLSTRPIVPSAYPFGALVTPDGKRGYISLWNASAVVELDLEAGKVARSIPLRKPASGTAAGSHPSAMTLSPDGSRLYVALANADEVAVVSTETGLISSFLSTRLEGQALPGAWPAALALDGEGRRLYAANAGTDTVAVFDLNEGAGKLLGCLPTEWYPTCVAVRGKDLLIATAKGRGAGPNDGKAPGGAPWARNGHPYVLALTRGSLARVDRAAAERDLAALTDASRRNNHLDALRTGLPFPPGQSPIRHVILVLKENRTYDQVFGDLKPGDGDPSLAMYGWDVTPNQHKLALEFGILDRFFDSGDVSGSGHNWSTAAATSDYLEWTLPIVYRSEARSYDYEGLNAGRIPLLDGTPDVNEPSTGYLWTLLARNHRTYRHYGEFVSTSWCGREPRWAQAAEGPRGPVVPDCPSEAVRKGEPLPSHLGDPPGGPSPWPWPIPMMAANVATKPELRDHFDPRYPDFEVDYPDQLRADEFLNEFRGFVEARRTGKGAALPEFVFLRLPNDHTGGTRPGRPTPRASVADNDLALGRVVEAVSHSPYWEDTAILVMEDDAQDGADHVDAHRSPALVISRFSPSSGSRPRVDSTPFTTVDMLRTAEALLGLPPMNHNDARAQAIASPFSGGGGHGAFDADWRNRGNGLLYQVNPPHSPGAEASERMDFSHADGAPAQLLNAILWRERFGDRPMPPPAQVPGAFLAPAVEVDPDDPGEARGED